MDLSTLKKPSAWLPIAMSLSALAVVAVHVAVRGPAPEPDEGTAAHLWQVLMAFQAPIVFFFSLRWVPRAPRQALPILAAQVAAALAAMAPVYLLKL
jgi:hypothetical protein